MRWSQGLSKFVAVNNSASITSSDGKAWTATTGTKTPQFGVQALVENGAYFMCFGNGAVANMYTTSSNGLSWSPTSTLPTGTTANNVFWQGAAASGSKWVVVGQGNTAAASGTVITSSDGVTWSPPIIPTGSQTMWNSVVYASEIGRWVAVGNYALGGGAMYSDDGGATWTTVQVPSIGSIGNWKALTWTGQLFVAVDDNNQAPGAIMTSPDGITWTIANSGLSKPSYTAMAWSGRTMVLMPGSSWLNLDKSLTIPA
jgi:hypothetical protein